MVQDIWITQQRLFCWVLKIPYDILIWGNQNSEQMSCVRPQVLKREISGSNQKMVSLPLSSTLGQYHLTRFCFPQHLVPSEIVLITYLFLFPSNMNASSRNLYCQLLYPTVPDSQQALNTCLLRKSLLTTFSDSIYPSIISSRGSIINSSLTKGDLWVWPGQ